MLGASTGVNERPFLIHVPKYPQSILGFVVRALHHLIGDVVSPSVPIRFGPLLRDILTWYPGQTSCAPVQKLINHSVARRSTPVWTCPQKDTAAIWQVVTWLAVVRRAAPGFMWAPTSPSSPSPSEEPTRCGPSPGTGRCSTEGPSLPRTQQVGMRKSKKKEWRRASFRSVQWK